MEYVALIFVLMFLYGLVTALFGDSSTLDFCFQLIGWVLGSGCFLFLFFILFESLKSMISPRTDDKPSRSYDEYKSLKAENDKHWGNAHKSSSPSPRTSPSPPSGGVYLIKSGRFYKIGKAKVFDKRIKQIRLLQPEPVEVIHKIHTHDATATEKMWHRKFAAKRKTGEWFQLSDADVEEFKKR